MADKKGLAGTGDWLRLQRKIFTRWVNQKVSKKNIKVNDVVTDIGDGLLLVALIEVLSDTKYTGKLDKNPNIRVKKIDNTNNALNFCWSAGVHAKNKPSAENLVDGDEKSILGLIWSIMLKYMKIGDEDGADQLNARDALLLWVQNKVVGLPNIGKVDNFTTSFHDGLVLCGIIYKHRPKLIPTFPTLTKANPHENLRIAMDAAEKFFGLEKYLAPEDIQKLDENSMVIYVSEYYYGIAEQRKIDIAARRIGKVIRVTKEIDALKAEFIEKSNKFVEHIQKVEKILADRTIDNTMAGAKKKIEDFYEYKSKDKNVLIDQQLDLEALYNSLAMKLALNMRAEFVPPAGTSLKDIEKTMQHLEACEQERKVALHAELNRQILLAKQNDEHIAKYNKLTAWVAEKRTYLQKKEEISSVSEAQLHLRLLDGFDKEATSVRATSFAALAALGSHLAQERFERANDARAREGEVAGSLAELSGLSHAKRPVLEDDLEREKFKERVRLLNQQHIDKHKNLTAWATEKQSYLNTKAEVSSVPEAQTHLTLLAAYDKELASVTATSLAQFHLLGKDILAQHYQTTHSSWKFENPEELNAREAEVSALWGVLKKAAEDRGLVLQDDLVREQFKAKVRLLNKQHVDKHDKLVAWINEKEAYLKRKEVVNSIGEAQTQLTLLEAFDKEKASATTVNVAQFKQLGAEILAQEYKKLSEWKFENPQEISDRQAAIDAGWENLTKLTAVKLEILTDDLTREHFKEKLRLLNEEHIDKHNKLQVWAAEQEVYLKRREEVVSVNEAQTQLSLLEVYQKEKTSTTVTNVAQLQALGADILAQKYNTTHSSYEFPNPSEITDRESAVHASWGDLDLLAILKKAILDDHLARELFKDKVRLQVQEHTDVHTKLQGWVAEKEAYLQTRESINSVSEAQTQLTLLEAFEKEKVTVAQTNVAHLKALGADIRAQKYETEHSSWVFETPEELTAHEGEIDAKWESLATLSTAKKVYLEEQLRHELEKERLRLEFAHIASDFTRWKKDTSDQVASSTQFGFTIEEVEAARATLDVHHAEVLATAAAKEEECRKVYADMLAAGAKENIYTAATPESLSDLTALRAAIAERDAAHAQALAAERANEALRKAFAELAEPFNRWIAAQKDAITTSKDVLEVQLGNVEAKIASVPRDGERLAPIKAKSDELDAAGIVNNTHTSLTYKDLEVQWNQYKAFLERKKKMLEEEQERVKLRGLTPDQLEEIRTTFNTFDINKSHSIDKKELKACLYSLGEEKSKSEIDAIVAKYGRAQEQDITYEGFREFMILIYGDADTRDEIVGAFSLVSRGDTAAKKEVIEQVMPEPDVEYFTATAPQAPGGGYNYQAWLEKIYSQ